MFVTDEMFYSLAEMVRSHGSYKTPFGKKDPNFKESVSPTNLDSKGQSAFKDFQVIAEPILPRISQYPTTMQS